MAKLLYKTKYLNLYETKRGFIYAQRRNINSTAALCYRKVANQYQFLIRYQPLPEVKIKNFKPLSWKQLYPCCVTGSMESKEQPVENIIREILEETNYQITPNNIVSQTICSATSQSNEMVYVYLVDLTNSKMINKPLGDGSIFEAISKNVWLNQNDLQNIIFNNKEFYLASLAVAYLMFLKEIKHVW